ncbi:MAG: 23S rRNA (guanosine(2251)-2'-O)-methyltransferase RlmB [Leptospira sp.]|nr:23S rRNA (guanosine(2251)-2'-O)-methyltransferase RlmB [Leptospira sp.]
MEKNPIKKKAIYGRRNVEEFIAKGSIKNVTEAWVKDSFHGEALSTILKDLPDKSIVLKKTSREMDRSLHGVNHQGVVLWAFEKSVQNKPKKYQDWKENLEPHQGPFLLLDRIQDPGNMGSIIRTAECFGVNTVIYPERGSCGITDVVLKISSGALHHLNVFQVANLSRVVEELKKKNYWVVSTTDQGDENWEDLPDAEDLAIILGNEGEGVKPILLEESDYAMRIPLHGEVSSLNVGVACGIILDRIVNR